MHYNSNELVKFIEKNILKIHLYSNKPIFMLRLILILNDYTGQCKSNFPSCALGCHLLYMLALIILTQCMVKSRITTGKPEGVVGSMKNHYINFY